MTTTTEYRGINVRVDQAEWLRREADRRDVSVNALIRELIDGEMRRTK